MIYSVYIALKIRYRLFTNFGKAF